MKCTLFIDPEVFKKCFKIWIEKLQKANENGLRSLLYYDFNPKSMNYEVFVSIIVSN